MYIHWPVYDVYVQCADLSTSSLLNLHSGLFIYKHVIGHAGLLSTGLVSRQYIEFVFCYGGLGGLSPRHSIIARLFLRCDLRIVSHIVIGTRFCT